MTEILNLHNNRRHTRDLKMSETKQNDTKPSEVKPRKVVGRNVAIALGIICIVLVAGLGVVLFMSYSPTSGSLQKQLDDLTTTYNNYVSTHGHTDSEYDSLVTEKANLQNQYQTLVSQQAGLTSQIAELTSIVNLGKSTVWVNEQTVSQPAGGLGITYTTWTESAPYAGYVTINVSSSTTTSTYAEVMYLAYDVNYNNHVNIGSGGTAYFPVLPSSNIIVGVGNGNLINGATETVTITYYY
jgi:hypothetical protein